MQLPLQLAHAFLQDIDALEDPDPDPDPDPDLDLAPALTLKLRAVAHLAPTARSPARTSLWSAAAAYRSTHRPEATPH